MCTKRKFLSTLSLRRATAEMVPSSWTVTIFLSTLSLRRATSQCRTLASGMYGFLSTLSLRRATHSKPTHMRTYLFLSTLSLRRATAHKRQKAQNKQISIHALLAESDPDDSVALVPHQHFYPRSPCGERPTFIIYSIIDKYISIHALLAESDCLRCLAPRTPGPFLSTLSLRRATLFLRFGRMTRRYFYPRSPCGERLVKWQQGEVSYGISIHALLAESDAD